MKKKKWKNEFWFLVICPLSLVLPVNQIRLFTKTKDK